MMALIAFGTVTASAQQEGAAALGVPHEAPAPPQGGPVSDVPGPQDSPWDANAFPSFDEPLPRDEPARPSKFHLGFDVSWHRARIRFLTPVEYAVAGCGCGMANLNADLLRGTLSIGWAGLALEGSFSRAIRTDNPFNQWTVGVRLDTGYDAAVSLAIRLAYLRRGGAVAGEGGRGSAALQFRLWRFMVAYAEIGADVTTVPANADTVLSYALTYGAGLRFVIAP